MHEILFTRTWWRYHEADDHWYHEVYHWFNLFEAAAWLVFAALVLRRFARYRQSYLELWYALAFLTFAATDLQEAWAQSSWLLWLKLINLLLLLWLRRTVRSRYYPAAPIY